MSETPLTPQDIIDYHGWKGNGDSRASARFTWFAVLWLSNTPTPHEQSHTIANAEGSVPDAAETLKTFVAQALMGDLLETTSLATDILRSVLEHEINWTEIVEALRESAVASEAIPPTETQEAQLAPIPTNWVSREDLQYCRPDVAEQIAALSEGDVKRIAEKIGDALQETYWLAMGIILDEYFPEIEADEDEDAAEPPISEE